MKPGTHNIEIMQGDSFDEMYVRFDSLAPRGGPANLVGGKVVRAQVRKSQDPNSELYATFDVQIVDAANRRVRPKLTPVQTAALTRDGYWDLQVEDPATGWIGTILKGKATVIKEVTSP